MPNYEATRLELQQFLCTFFSFDASHGTLKFIRVVACYYQLLLQPGKQQIQSCFPLLS